MELYALDTELFRLDGGAIFGVVPKSIWNKKLAADEKNLVTLSMRLLLIQDGNRLILIDTGIGNKQSEKFFGHYYLDKTNTLDNSLAKIGFSKEDITDVFLTHLHFDHVGGAVTNVNGKLQPTFKNATYWSNRDHWTWATEPNARERPSFLKENFEPLLQTGQIKYIDVDSNHATTFTENVTIFAVNGHTQAMMLPLVSYKGKSILFTADLFITRYHLPVNYTAAYDVAPLQTMKEKDLFLKKAIENDYILFFEHDHATECCTLQQTEKGIIIEETFKLTDLH